jgi:hypothetical protein
MLSLWDLFSSAIISGGFDAPALQSELCALSRVRVSAYDNLTALLIVKGECSAVVDQWVSPDMIHIQWQANTYKSHAKVKPLPQSLHLLPESRELQALLRPPAQKHWMLA